MLGAACQYKPQQHLLLEPKFLEWCKEQITDESVSCQLFVYRQMQEGTFVIGRWIDKPFGLFVDLINLGGSLGNFTREIAHEFRRRLLAPVTADRTCRQMTEFNSQWHSNQEEKNLYNHDLLLRNKMIPE